MDVGVTMSPTTYFFTAVLSPTRVLLLAAAFAKTAHFATKTGQVAMTDLCREWGMSKTQGYEILKRWRTEEAVATDRTSSCLLSNQNQTRGFVCVVRTHTLGSTPRAYPRALGRCVREHSSLSRGHRRCAHEPTYSRSRRVVIRSSFVSAVDTTCA